MTQPYYQDEAVTLYHGDCLDEVDEWLAADVLVTDPPYGIGYATNMGGQFTGKPVAGDSDTDARDSALAAWGDRPAVVFASYKCRPYGAPHPMPLIFDKGDVVGMGDLSWPWKPNYEMAWVYGTGWQGKRTGAILSVRVLPGNFTPRAHPTEKPSRLLELVIEKAPDGVIADPFAGSGSTLLAARNLGRRAIGVELEERYCEIIARRLSQGVLL